MKYPYEAVANTLAKGAVDGARSFLGAICMPAATEFGLLVEDKVRFWRAKNALQITEKAQLLLRDKDISGMSAYPRIVMEALDKGSWESEDKIQNKWAGLLASSVTPDGEDDSNLLFVDLLGRMSNMQVKILDYACEFCNKYHSSSGWIFGGGVVANIDRLEQITGSTDKHRIDRELDYLRELGLIGGGFGGGFEADATDADISPTSLALQMYVRCQGYVGAPTEYFGTTEENPEKIFREWENKKVQAKQSGKNASI